MRRGEKERRPRSPFSGGEGVVPGLLRSLRRRVVVGIPFLCLRGVDRVAVGSGGVDLERRSLLPRMNKLAVLPLPGRRRRVDGVVVPPTSGSRGSADPRSFDLWRSYLPVDGGSALLSSLWGAFCPQARRRAAASSGGGMSFGRCCAWRSSRSSSLSVEGDDFDSAAFCSSSPSSSGHAEAEIDDFPSALMLPQDSRSSPAPGGSGGGAAAARLRSASVVAEEWVPRDLVVIFFFIGCFSAVLG